MRVRLQPVHSYDPKLAWVYQPKDDWHTRWLWIGLLVLAVLIEWQPYSEQPAA